VAKARLLINARRAIPFTQIAKGVNRSAAFARAVGTHFAALTGRAVAEFEYAVLYLKSLPGFRYLQWEGKAFSVPFVWPFKVMYVDYGKIPTSDVWRFDRYLQRGGSLNADEWLDAVTRMRENFRKGGTFENSVLLHLGIDPDKLVKDIVDGGFRPDLPIGDLYGVTDIKDVVYIRSTPQLQGFFQAAGPGRPFRLIISTRTTQISAKVIAMILKKGGEIWEFDAVLGKFTRRLVLPKKGRPWYR
jgi:hypothetical protein